MHNVTVMATNAYYINHFGSKSTVIQREKAVQTVCSSECDTKMQIDVDCAD